MSNPGEKITNTEEEITEQNFEDSDDIWSDLEEGEKRELRKQAVVAANLVVAAAQEAEVMTGTVEPPVGESGKKERLGRPKKVRFDDLNAASGASGSSEEGEAVKKPKKKGSSIFTNPLQGPQMCNVCGKGFLSWKGVFGHLRLHKDRGYLGFLPLPTFKATDQGVSVDVASSSTGGRRVGLGVGGIGIDLNVDPVEKEEVATASGSSPAPKFDLNRSPPNEEEEEEEGDKAE